MPENYAVPVNGVPSHFQSHVTGFQSVYRPGCPYFVPPHHHPILPLLDYFLWRRVEDVAYRTKVNGLPDLLCRIVGPLASLTLEMLNTRTEAEYQDVCRALRGAHVELYSHDKIFNEILHFMSQRACSFIFIWSEVSFIYRPATFISEALYLI
jgi:hypothetical protein